jgi:hypothetical protein
LCSLDADAEPGSGSFSAINAALAKRHSVAIERQRMMRRVRAATACAGARSTSSQIRQA